MKIRGECDIIEEIIQTMKEFIVVSESEFEETDVGISIENLDKLTS